MALFRIKEGRPMVILHPSKNLARVI